MSDHTVSQVAKIFSRSRDGVTTMITSGKLDAYDAAPDGCHRQWRVTPEALDKFRNENQARPPAKPRKRVTKPLREYV